MKEYFVELRVKVEDEELEKYSDINELIFSNMEEVPFSFSIENVHKIKINKEES